MTNKLTWTNSTRKLSDLTPWPRNPRQIDDAQSERLGESWDEFGQVETLAIGPDNELYDGHQRLKVLAAQHGPDFEVDVRVSSRPLTEKEREKLTVMLVKASGEWDWDLLEDWDAGELVEWGFDADELEFDKEKKKVKDPGPQIDKAAELQKVWQTELGQIWELGEHRLACGDCTNEAVVAGVMGGEKAEMMFTDPPYGVGYTGGIQFHKDGTVETQNRTALVGDGDTGIYAKFLPVVLPFVDGPCYVWFADRGGKPVYDAIVGNGCQIHAMIIWHKVNATYAAMNAQYKQRHEPCMYFKPKGSTLRWVGPTNECTVWDEKRDGVNEYHPTQKPVVLPERAIGNHDAQIVLDPFAGSGSTIIACEGLGRKARAIELDPGYCAVTLQRYLDATGKEPKLIKTL